MTYLKFAENDAGHSSDSTPLEEQVAIVTAVNAIEQSPFWRDTAIIITYDDSDGRYDHVAGSHIIEGIERDEFPASLLLLPSRCPIAVRLGPGSRLGSVARCSPKLFRKKRAHPYAHLACSARRLPHRRGYQY